MATIVHDGHGMSASPARRGWRDWVVIGALVGWVVVGPLLGLIYGRHVNTRDWYDLAGMPPAPQEDMQVAYFTNAAIYYAIGVCVWAAGLIFLAMFQRFGRSTGSEPQD